MIFENVRDALAQQFEIDPETITPDAELASDLGLNSIELANLVMLCEEKFDVTIDDDDIHKFVTIADVAEYLEAQQ